MGNNKKMQQHKQDAYEYIKEISQSEDGYARVKDIVEYVGVKRRSIVNYIHEFNNERAPKEQIIAVYGKGYKYVNNPEGERYDSTKNDEGYNDPTAASVIFKYEGGPAKEKELWIVDEPNGEQTPFAVLQSNSRYVSGVKFCKNAALDSLIFPVHIWVEEANGKSIKYSADCGIISYKLNKFISHKYRDLTDEEFSKIKYAVSKALHIAIAQAVKVEYRDRPETLETLKTSQIKCLKLERALEAADEEIKALKQQLAEPVVHEEAVDISSQDLAVLKAKCAIYKNFYETIMGGLNLK